MSLVVAPGPNTSATPLPLQLVRVVVRDRAADDDEHVLGAVLAQQLEDARHERHVRAGEDRDADRVRVLLDRRLDDLLRRLVEAGVDDLHAGVAQRARDDLRAAVVPVEARLRDDDSDLPGHAEQSRRPASRARCPRRRGARRTSRPSSRTAREASMIGSIRLRSLVGGVFASAARAPARPRRESRRARSAWTRSICCLLERRVDLAGSRAAARRRAGSG